MPRIPIDQAARICCAVSALAYDPTNQQLRGELAAAGCLNIRVIEEPATDTQAVIVIFPERVVIGYRGTEPGKILDLLTDADCRKVDFHAGKVHAGFLRAYASVKFQVAAAVADALALGLEVLLTGHSLGGALAAITFYDLHRKGTNPAALDALYCLTYGSPRWCDRAAAVDFDFLAAGRCYRFANAVDLVPRIPLWYPSAVALLLQYANDYVPRVPGVPAWVADSLKLLAMLPGGFWHVGGLVTYGRDGKPVSSDCGTLTRERLGAYWAHLGKLGLAGFEAHGVSEYRRVFSAAV